LSCLEQKYTSKLEDLERKYMLKNNRMSTECLDKGLEERPQVAHYYIVTSEPSTTAK
jgi:hypothetical protein